MAGYWII